MLRMYVIVKKVLRMKFSEEGSPGRWSSEEGPPEDR